MLARNRLRHAVRRARAVVVASAALAACGSNPGTRWADYDRSVQRHATDEPSSRSPRTTSASVARSPSDIDALPYADARALLDRLDGRAPAARVALRAARLAHHVGDAAQARALLARAALAADEPEVRASLVALGAQLDIADVDKATVAVLLPLTGRHAAVGNELRAAIELAPAHGTKWAFLDTRGESAGAAAAVERAVAIGAVGALGPVGAREVVAAGRAAALYRLPIALLAPGDGADPTAGVFRFVGSPADEARAVAAIALAENFSAVAVLAPADDVGLEVSEAFVAEAHRLGLRVEATGSYDPTGGEVERDVKRFLNLVPGSNPRFAAHLRTHGSKGWQTFSPDIGFSLLYIPDRYDRAAVVAAFLPYFGVELRTTEFSDPMALRRKHRGEIPQVVQLVGGSGWNHPSLTVRGAAAVQGARIVDVFAGGRSGEAAWLFADAFERKTGRAPSSAAAEVFDAATLAAAARETVPGQSADARESYRLALASARIDDGACGPATIGRDGEIVRESLMLEVVGDELELVE